MNTSAPGSKKELAKKHEPSIVVSTNSNMWLNGLGRPSWIPLVYRSTSPSASNQQGPTLSNSLAPAPIPLGTISNYSNRISTVFCLQQITQSSFSQHIVVTVKQNNKQEQQSAMSIPNLPLITHKGDTRQFISVPNLAHEYKHPSTIPLAVHCSTTRGEFVFEGSKCQILALSHCRWVGCSLRMDADNITILWTRGKSSELQNEYHHPCNDV